MIHRIMVLSAILLASVSAWGQGCLETRSDINGPCVASKTLPGGEVVTKHADGTIWLTVKEGTYRFEMPKAGVQEATGNFFGYIVTKIAQSEDIIEAPQFTRMEIYGDCSSNTYRINDFAITDPNGFLQSSGPEDVTRRVMSDTPVATVFGVTCKP